MPSGPIKTPKIVQPGRRPLLPWLLGLALLAGVAWLAYDRGRQNAGYFAEASQARIAALEQRVGELQQSLANERELAARYQRASQIDKAAVATVRQELGRLQSERAELRKRIAFLESLISGKVTALEVSEAKLAPKEGKTRQFAFSFLVSKRDKGNDRVTGRIRLAVEGERDGKKVTLEEDKLGLKDPIKMGFKHYQRFEGVLTLPEGVRPRALVVKGRPEGKRFKPFERRIEWPAG